MELVPGAEESHDLSERNSGDDRGKWKEHDLVTDDSSHVVHGSANIVEEDKNNEVEGCAERC